MNPPVIKTLITGGSGFIGSNLVRLLVEEKGESVINLDKLTYAGNAESLADLDGNNERQNIELVRTLCQLLDELNEKWESRNV